MSKPPTINPENNITDDSGNQLYPLSNKNYINPQMSLRLTSFYIDIESVIPLTKSRRLDKRVSNSRYSSIPYHLRIIPFSLLLITFRF